MNCMIANECVQARNFAVFRPSLDELKCDSRPSPAINIYQLAFLYQDIVTFFVLCLSC